MSLISLGEINKNILYPIIGGLSKLIAEFILFIKEPQFTKYPFILGAVTGFGMFLSIIPFIILKIKLRKENTEKQANDKLLIYNNPDDVFHRKVFCIKYLLIFCASLLDFSQKSLTFLFPAKIINNFWVFDILFITFFSRIVLKSKLYSYQLFSLGMIIILGIIFNIVNLVNSGDFNFISFILVMSIEIIFSLEIVIEKYTMEYKFCSPYEICIFEGLFEIIANVILLIISHNIGKDDDEFFNYINDLQKKEVSIKVEIILLFVSMVSRLFFKLFSLITINLYTSSHVVILLILGEIMLIFTKGNKEEDKLYIFRISCNILLVVLLFLMFLVFTEFVELNFCGLQKYTKKNIEKRALTEISLDIEKNNNEDFRDSCLEPINDEEENEIPSQKEI